MADARISDLPAASSLLPTDELVIASGGSSRKVTGAVLGMSLEGPGWVSLVKQADEEVASSTDIGGHLDDELHFVAVSGAIYDFETVLIYASPAGAGVPDFKWSITRSYDTLFHGNQYVLHYSAADGIVDGSGQLGTHNPVITGAAATKRVARSWGYYLGDGAVCGLWWSQNTSDPNPTVVYAGSTLRYRRIA